MATKIYRFLLDHGPNLGLLRILSQIAVDSLCFQLCFLKLDVLLALSKTLIRPSLNSRQTQILDLLPKVVESDNYFRSS